jgi:hypothetical protein
MIASRLSLAALLLTTSLSFGQDSDKKKAAKEAAKEEVEIHYANGSMVRMVLLDFKLEVVTRYGKLSIPAADVRRIEFGVHLPEGMDKKIHTAIKNLNNDAFKERDKAEKELITMGVHAYPAVHHASKSNDPEVAQRAQTILKRISAKVPAKELRLREDDQIITPTFTVVGQIVTPVIKANSEYFGDVDVKLPQVRSLRMLTGPSEAEVVVDASRYGSAPNQWMETEININRGMGLQASASGQVDIYPSGGRPSGYVCGPAGYGQGNVPIRNLGGIQPGTNTMQFPGALLGKLGANGEIFVIGERYDAVPPGEGRLYLHIGPSPWGNASTGTYKVKLATK